MKVKVVAFFLLVSSAVVLFSNDKLLKRDYWPTSEWRSSSPRKQGMDATRLKEIDTYVKESLPLTSSVLVVRDGYTVFERYYDENPKKRRAMWCAPKVSCLDSLV